VQAGHESAGVAEYFERAATHARHDAHRDRDVRRVGELDADVRDFRAEGAHREGYDVHRAPLHRSSEEGVQGFAHLGGVAPVVGRTGVGLVLRADERAVLDARDVTRVRVRVVAVRTLRLGQFGEGARVDEQLAQFVVLLGRSVAPVDTIRGCEPRHFLDPFNELFIFGWVRHFVLIYDHRVVGLRRETTTAVMSAPADPTKERSQHEDDVLERIAKIVATDVDSESELYVGDDAAVLKPFVGEAIISTDVAVLGIHLDAELFSLRDLGYKAVTSALSDLAAMGARPRGVVLAVSAPPGTDLEEIHEGAVEATRATGTAIIGGDLSGGRDVTVAVTVLGECPGRGAVLRSGARAGDELLVTGPLGRAAAGLRRRREGAELTDELVEPTGDRGRVSPKEWRRVARTFTR
jgi:hypothetical protein